MKFVTRPPTETNGVGHGGDDLDEALFAFFRSEMPQKWSPPKLPDDAPRVRPAQPAAAPPRRSWFRSPRFALAASVALLIGGAAVLSAVLTPPQQAGVTGKDLNGGGAHALPAKLPPAPEDPADDDVDFRGWLEQDGNSPTTIHIELYKHK